MTTSHFAKSRQVHRQLLILLASTALFTAGCSNLASTASSSSGASANVITIGGQIHGGNQPVSGATVNLYFAGQGPGLPSAATLVATTLSSSDGSGNFNFTRLADGGTSNGTSGNSFSCPLNPPNSPAAANGGPIVFVVARGGNTVNDGSTSVNNDSVFIAPYGRCGGISAATFVSMSELVTAATVAAIHQYMDPTVSPIESSIGADGIYISDNALQHSFATVSNLVDLGTGMSRGATTRAGSTTGGTGVAGVSVTVTPEQAKLNHIGNILSSCINNANSGSTACATLYNNAVPPPDYTTTSAPAAGPTPTDVLQAAYYLYTNPTNVTASDTTNSHLLALYGIPTTAGAPYQPQLTTPPSDWTMAINYTSTGSCSDVTTPTAGFINSVADLAIDINGNLYFANGQTGGGSLGAFSATGTPTSCYTLPAATNPVPGNGASSTIVDVNGNIWVGSRRSSDLYRYVPGTGATSLATASPVVALTSDGYGDVFYATSSGAIYELVNAANTPAIPAAVAIATNNLGNIGHIMMDTNNTIWVSTGTNTVAAVTGSVQLTNPASLGGFNTVTFAAPAATVGIAATQQYGTPGTFGPGVWLSSTGGVSSVSFLHSTGAISTPYGGGGLNNPGQVALDGAQNIWSTNPGNIGLSEFTKAGVPLSPGPTGFGKTFNNTSGQQSILIDASGNVWSGQTNSGNTITEIVGAAVPTYQPYALGLPPQPGTRFQKIP